MSHLPVRAHGRQDDQMRTHLLLVVSIALFVAQRQSVAQMSHLLRVHLQAGPEECARTRRQKEL